MDKCVGEIPLKFYPYQNYPNPPRIFRRRKESINVESQSLIKINEIKPLIVRIEQGIFNNPDREALTKTINDFDLFYLDFKNNTDCHIFFRALISVNNILKRFLLSIDPTNNVKMVTLQPLISEKKITHQEIFVHLAFEQLVRKENAIDTPEYEKLCKENIDFVKYLESINLSDISIKASIKALHLFNRLIKAHLTLIGNNTPSKPKPISVKRVHVRDIDEEFGRWSIIIIIGLLAILVIRTLQSRFLEFQNT